MGTAFAITPVSPVHLVPKENKRGLSGGTDMVKTSSVISVVDIKQCQGCQLIIRNSDKFCRHCGIKQGEAANRPTKNTSEVDNSASPSSNLPKISPAEPYSTKPLVQAAVPHPVSGPLLQAIVKGISTGASKIGSNKITQQSLLVLMSIPVWLLIVFLSPVDAWLATKSISKNF